MYKSSETLGKTGEAELSRWWLLSVRCANPDSRALNLRRFGGGGEWDGLGEAELGVLTGLGLVECLRFMVAWLNHGWRMGVEVAQVVISTANIRFSGWSDVNLVWLSGQKQEHMLCSFRQ